jgi:hypothetical protein
VRICMSLLGPFVRTYRRRAMEPPEAPGLAYVWLATKDFGPTPFGCLTETWEALRLVSLGM